MGHGAVGPPDHAPTASGPTEEVGPAGKRVSMSLPSSTMTKSTFPAALRPLSEMTGDMTAPQ